MREAVPHESELRLAIGKDAREEQESNDPTNRTSNRTPRRTRRSTGFDYSSCVDERDVSAAVAVRHHPARRAAHHRRRRLHMHRELPDVTVEDDVRDMQTIEADEHVATRAVRRVVRAARSNARRRLGQRRGLPVGQLGRYRSWRPRLFLPSDHATPGAPLTPTGTRKSPQSKRTDTPGPM